MPPIYLLRHGETEWNVEGRIQGALDSPLTERGRQQARQMGLALKQALKRATMPLYCSPLGRARQTLEIVCATAGIDAAACLFDDRLRELSWGQWDGMTRGEIDAATPGAMAARLSAHWVYKPPGGGSYAELAQTLEPFLREMASAGGIVISHGAVGRVLRGLHANLPSHEVLKLDEPQDVIFALHERGIEALSGG